MRSRLRSLRGLYWAVAPRWSYGILAALYGDPSESAANQRRKHRRAGGFKDQINFLIEQKILEKVSKENYLKPNICSSVKVNETRLTLISRLGVTGIICYLFCYRECAVDQNFE